MAKHIFHRRGSRTTEKKVEILRDVEGELSLALTLMAPSGIVVATPVLRKLCLALDEDYNSQPTKKIQKGRRDA